MTGHDKPKRRAGGPLQVYLTRSERRAIDRIAETRQVTLTALIRGWIRDASEPREQSSMPEVEE